MSVRIPPLGKWVQLAVIATALVAALGACSFGLQAAELTVLTLPAGFIADNATEAAVLCSISDGYPDNIYAVKGTFSTGMLPYYGLTYNPAATLWASQQGAWSTAQMKVQTDHHGDWRGYLIVRLEQTAPRGEMLFRFSAVPLSPINLPGPTVSEWYPIYALDPDATGGWLSGHVYRDTACAVPASGVVVQATDAFGRTLGAYLCQYSCVMDDEDWADTGFVRIGIPKGTVTALTGRTRYAGHDGPAGTLVPLYTRRAGPWRVEAGQTVCFDDSPWGDADGDGALTAADAAFAARLAGGFLPAAPGRDLRADVWPLPPDARVTMEDALAILMAVRPPQPP